MSHNNIIIISSYNVDFIATVDFNFSYAYIYLMFLCTYLVSHFGLEFQFTQDLIG